MNNLTYVTFVWKNHRGFALFSMVVIAAMQLIIINLISSMDTLSIITVLLEQLPEQFQALISEQFLASLSLKGAAAFGFQHPLVLALLAINAINVPTRHIVGEIESGTLELLLAYPIRRTRLLLSLWLAAGSLLLLVVCGSLVGSFSALGLIHEFSLDVAIRMLKIAGNLWLLFLFIMSYTLLLATFGREGSKIGLYGAGITLIFYFLDLLSTLWDAVDFTKPFNIFTYFQPQKLMFDQRSFWLHYAVLSTLIAICLFISVRQFNRRDIPG